MIISQKRSMKGQAALEYMITYGWAFIGILAAVGIMMYFGLLNPDRYTSTSCEFSPQLSCEDYLLTDGGTLSFRFTNNFDDDITITSATVNGNPIDIPDVNSQRGDVTRVDIPLGNTYDPGDKEKLTVLITIQRQTNALEAYNIGGNVVVEVIEDAII